MLLFNKQKSAIILVTADRNLRLVRLHACLSCTFKIHGTLKLLNFPTKLTKLLLSL